MRFRIYLVLWLLWVFWSCLPESIISNTPATFSGALLDVKLLGGSNEEVARALISLRNGGFAMVGSTNSSDGDFVDRSSDDWDMFLMVLDGEGAPIWKKSYGGSGDDFGFSLVETPEGGFVLCGYSNSQDGDVPPTQGYHDNWVIKVDDKGTIIWKKSMGYAGHDHAYNIIATQDGGYFFNGYLDVTASGGLGNSGKTAISNRHGVGEFWCHKIDANGEILWQRYFGGTNNDRSYDAIQTTDGNFLVVGTSESDDTDVTNAKGSYDLWAIMISPDGTLLWEKSFGGKLIDEGSKVIEDFSGNFRIIGNTFSNDQDVLYAKGSSDIWQITLDPSGNIIENNSWGGSEFDKGTSIAYWQWGSFFVAGYSRSSDGDFLNNQGENDLFLMHLPPNGYPPQTYSLGGADHDYAFDLLALKNGKVMVVGQTYSSELYGQKNKGKSDILIAQWY